MPRRTKTTCRPAQAVVVGFGNILLKDEGIGVHVIQQMDGLPGEYPQEYLIVDGATCPDFFFHLPEAISTLIVIDAVLGGGEPGTIYRFTPDDIEFKRTTNASLHQLGFREGLAMMKVLGNYPERVIVIGVEPKEIDCGLKISPDLEEIIPQVILLVHQELAN